jgi:hypothetical protein
VERLEGFSVSAARPTRRTAETFFPDSSWRLSSLSGLFFDHQFQEIDPKNRLTGTWECNMTALS